MTLRSTLDTARRIGGLDPLRVASFGAAAFTWGPTIASAQASAALRHPLRTALIDEVGSLTHLQLDLRTTRVAGALQARGITRAAPVGILCRNHRGFVEANLALAKLGARTVYLNPTLPSSQLQTVIERERIVAVLADEDLLAHLDQTSDAVDIISVAPERDRGWSFPDLPRWRPLLQLPHPLGHDDPVVLTSGTTGAPKGTTRRPGPRAAASAFGVLETVPYRQGDVIVLPAPLFHAWGLSQLVLASFIGGTVVLRRRFDAAETLHLVEEHRADVLAAVPVMLHRMLHSDATVDTSSLRIVASSGSALPAGLATRWLDRFGPTLYNLYGSTEVGQVSVAGPAQLGADPASAGEPLRGVEVRIVDESGADVATGDVGRIVVRSAMHFDGYTDGGTKELVGDYMDIGDLGRIDPDGQIFVVGRADDMIISGGENIHPSNIERALAECAGISESAVVGVADDDLGQRVRAVIVTDSPPDAALLKQTLHDSLASHEIPREFVFVDALPRNAAGKILRRDLTSPSLASNVAGSPSIDGPTPRSSKRKTARS